MSEPTTAPVLRIADEAGVRTLSLDRPEALNAFNAQLHTELAEALRAAERDSSIRVVVLTGVGRAFCVGQDLKDLERRRGSDGALRVDELLRRTYNPLIKRLRTLEKPVIAAVNGVAAGAGLSLALACDLRLASEAASFVTAFSAIGLVPDSGSLYFLPRLIGWAKALELFLTSEKLGAQEALALGLASRVLPAEGFSPAVQEYAARLARGPAVAYGLTKRGLLRSVSTDLDQMLELEAQYQQIAVRTADFGEGLTAFAAKRPAEFKGR
jgi:2-(1,2-epoxy-1,2-dihydrophenyl)acetyl-CoA isomerase